MVDKSIGLFGWSFSITCAVAAGCSAYWGCAEKIILGNDALTWVSWTGKVKASILLNEIAPGALTSLRRWGLRYRIQGKDGQICFSTNLSDLGLLISVALELAYGPGHTAAPTPEAEPAIGAYRYEVVFVLIPVVCLAFIGFFVWMIADKYRNTTNPDWHTIASFFSPISLITPASFLFYTFFWGRWALQTITITASGVIWKDLIGRVRLNVTYEDFIPGTMTWSRGNGNIIYRVETIHGPLIWNSQIKHGGRLAYLLRDVARQPFLPLPNTEIPLFPAPDYTSALPTA
jgi:hypothetical protein